MRWLLLLLVGCNDGEHLGPAGVVHLELGNAYARFAQQSGTCLYRYSTMGACSLVTQASNCGHDENLRSAGAVSFAWTDAGGREYATLSPDGSDRYSPQTFSIPAGSRVSVSAGGGDVPAFDGDLDLPIAPSLIQGFSQAIDRSRDLSLTWDPQAAMGVWIALRQSGDAPSVECRFDAPSGAGTIPAAALQAFSPGAGSASATIGMVDHLVDSGWDIQLQAAAAIPLDGTPSFN